MLQGTLSDSQTENVQLSEALRIAREDLIQFGEEKEDFLSQQAELTALLTQERQTVGTQNQQIEEANQSSQKLRAHLDTQQAELHQAGEEL